MKEKIVVLGGGISGYGSAILAQKEGFDVLLSDSGELSHKYRSLLDEAKIEYEQGGHSADRILEASQVIKSPGIPDKTPIIVALRERGIPVISEIEFAGRYLGDARTICITGSNGKTTTTSLIYRMLLDAGYSVALGGNIGESFALSVATQNVDWYVLEISSFQLDGMFSFRADIAVLLNITPDHLDRYDYNFDNYIASKMRIEQNQTPEDHFIYFADDKNITPSGRAQRLPFSKDNIVDERVIHIDGIDIYIEQIQLSGLHNYYNVQAASLAALAAGISGENIIQSLSYFAPVEHRLEPAGQINGVRYINDSKATNVDSVWYALEAMTCPTVWIAGGTDKGNDYSQLIPLAKKRVHTLITMGINNTPLEEAMRGVIPSIITAHSLDEAMTAARKSATEGDVVLLSPACASFDLFRNYEERGGLFKEWVKNHQSQIDNYGDE